MVGPGHHPVFARGYAVAGGMTQMMLKERAPFDFGQDKLDATYAAQNCLRVEAGRAEQASACRGPGPSQKQGTGELPREFPINFCNS
jgi:hypothetical protein